jgi:hypothetical protein
MSKRFRECEGQCCQPLSEGVAVYVEGVTGTMRLCPLCAAALESLPPLPENDKKEYQEQYRHFKETGEVLPTPSERALRKRIKDLAESLGVPIPNGYGQ